MKRILLACLLLCVCTTTTQADDWTKMDTALQTAFVAATVADWAQTRQISSQPEFSRPADRTIRSYTQTRYREMNPILGEHPSTRAVNTYFVTYIITHTTISYLLPKPYRTIWQSVFVGVEIAYVRSNYNIGLKIKF